MPDPTVDRTSPDAEWIGDPFVASNHDVAAAIAHVKAWVLRELGRPPAPPEQPPVPGVTTQPTDGSVPQQTSEPIDG